MPSIPRLHGGKKPDGFAGLVVACVIPEVCERARVLRVSYVTALVSFECDRSNGIMWYYLWLPRCRCDCHGECIYWKVLYDAFCPFLEGWKVEERTVSRWSYLKSDFWLKKTCVMGNGATCLFKKQKQQCMKERRVYPEFQKWKQNMYPVNHVQGLAVKALVNLLSADSPG